MSIQDAIGAEATVRGDNVRGGSAGGAAAAAAAARRHVMAVLAAAPAEALEAAFGGWSPVPDWQRLRGPETGLVMARGRAGGGGAPFNLGELTVTRTTVVLPTGEPGFAYILGRDRRKSELAAVFDALWQRTEDRSRVETDIIAPLAAAAEAADATSRAQSAATRVDFFTMVRGEEFVSPGVARATGFADPVFDSQAVFRAAMTAMATPGRVLPLVPRCAPPPGLAPELAALALTLADFETRIWLDRDLAADSAVLSYLAFETGAPRTPSPGEAAFALVGSLTALPDFAEFAQGTAEYPDRSTTVLLGVAGFDHATEVVLTGPGIEVEQRFSIGAAGSAFWRAMVDARQAPPLGVDVIFAAPGRVAAIPRSTHIQIVGA